MTKTLQIVRGDIVKTSTGRLGTIAELTKARQRMRRLLTLRRPQGAGIFDLVGTTPESSFELSSDLQTKVREAFSALTQAELQFQAGSRTLDERLEVITRMFVVPAKLGGAPSKTGYAFRVDARTASGEPVNVAGVLQSGGGG